MAKSKFYTNKENQDIIGVMSSLSQSLPDERPITAIALVENSSKCPRGFFPILKTYDEDSDADLWKQQPLFGKKTCRYLCLSKSEEISLFKMTDIRITTAGEAPPAGYSLVSTTSDTNRPAWRRKQICCLLTIDPNVIKKRPLLTDIIVCSRLKKAPDGFQYAGEINGMLICYKMSLPSSNIISENILSYVANNTNNSDDSHNYENVLHNSNDKRAAPERPPKLSSFVSELNKLNLENNSNFPIENLKSKDVSTSNNDDYEILSTSYNLQPSRPAPPVPLKPPTTYNAYTLGNWNALEGVPFNLNPKLVNMTSNQMPLVNIKRISLNELDRQYTYNFIVEKHV